MARKRPNPKKDKSARRRRPKVVLPAGLRRARLEQESLFTVMSSPPPQALPSVALTGVWLWNLAQDDAATAHCVDGCLTLHYALAEYGNDSRVEAIGLEIEGNGSHTRCRGTRHAAGDAASAEPPARARRAGR